jgi:hypothetical protein
MAQDSTMMVTGNDEGKLFVLQSMRYAEDVARLYEEGQVIRKELLRLKARLAAEITARRKAERELRSRNYSVSSLW